MLPLRFVPYHQLDGIPNAVVDGSAGAGTLLTLSHWPGSPTPAELLADLSAEIAFKALAEPHRFDPIDAVSNNHFDQDGVCGVYALIDPHAALERQAKVIDVAAAGDFGVVTHREAARIAMALAAYDSERSPIAAELAGLAYPEVCGLLYQHTLPLMTDLLDHPERWQHLWAEEDAHLQEGLDAIAAGVVTIEEHPAVDLAVVTVPDDWGERVAHRFTQSRLAALHPMAINSSTACLRVLVRQGRRYHLELRYETWVMLVSRRPLPRPDLRTLVAHLDERERGGARWEADAPGSLTPQLRLTSSAATADEIESSIAPEEFTALLIEFLATAPAAWDPFATR